MLFISTPHMIYKQSQLYHICLCLCLLMMAYSAVMIMMTKRQENDDDEEEQEEGADKEEYTYDFNGMENFCGCVQTKLSRKREIVAKDLCFQYFKEKFSGTRLLYLLRPHFKDMN